MKRIYMTMALLGGLAIGAKAQNIDFVAVVQMDSAACLKPGMNFTPTSPYTGADSVSGVWGVYNNAGPDATLTGDILWFASPFNQPGYYSGYTLAADGDIDAPILAFSYDDVDSIKSLIDMDAADTASTLYNALVAPPFVNNKLYGFYVDVAGIGDDLNAIESTDPDPNNNLDFQIIKWNCSGTSIKDMLAGKEKAALVVYPNPAEDQVKFDYSFDATTKTSVVRISDVLGRTVMVKDFGRNVAGTQKTFTMDVSSLKAGIYSIILETESKVATSKMTIRK